MQVDGGPRSFPSTSDEYFLKKFGYRLPNAAYERALYDQRPSQQESRLSSCYSAGVVVCPNLPPLVIGNSFAAMVHLFWSVLGTAVSDKAWEELSDAVVALREQRERDTLEEVATPVPEQVTDLAQSRRNEQGSLSQYFSSQEEPPSAQRPSSSSSSKRRRRNALECVQHTVTNNNRRAERARQKRVAAVEQQKRAAHGLVQPKETASYHERAAYDSIRKEDERLFASLIKRPLLRQDGIPFYEGMESPYALAREMIDKARAIGNLTTLSCTAAFLERWRKEGSPFATLGLPRRATRPSPVDIFNSAWKFCERYDEEAGVMDIQYRWAMAFLGQAYTNRIDEISQKHVPASSRSTRSRGGRGKVSSEAIDALISQLSTPLPDEERRKFVRRLGSAVRWSQLARGLGWGMLCLLPTHQISIYWVEKKINLDTWLIWLDLVAEINPDAHTASIAIDAWLGSTLSTGGSISDKVPLVIESRDFGSTTQVEEIVDSEGSGNECESQVLPSPTPVTLPRQLTLMDLCKPQQ